MSDKERAYELDWSHGMGEIGRPGLEVTRSATPDERAELARLLGILSVDALRVSYRIRAQAGERYRLTGRLDATVQQSCVVTLEPVVETVGEPLAVEFWPAADVESRLDTEFDALSEDDPEAIDGDRLPVGPYIYQVLASSLAPYPRASGLEDSPDDAEAKAQAETDATPAKESPFAVLKSLKGAAGDGT